ncbi:MAG: exodeoxyribonuclease VII small subunit [Candidatus Zixiibacteriota bacterium]|nr:MAG: exodeoxyribonuclease VII small subunit [candidate division Zixibacteria bacterium]
MTKRTPKIEKLGFEDAIERLEELIEQIESGEIGLEESLKRYEEGSALIKRCRSILDDAHQKIYELTASPDGGLAVNGDENQGDTAEDADD